MLSVKSVLALHDLSTYGRCSLTCVIPVLSTLGVKVCPLPTAVYSSDTGGFGPVYAKDLTEEMPRILEKLEAIPAKFDGIYSGYLGAPDQVRFVEALLRRHDCLKVVDPVMGDNGKLYSAFDDSMVEQMRVLCRAAGVITPNITEASFLLREVPPQSLSDAEAKAFALRLYEAFGAQVVITSAPLSSHPDRIFSLICDGKTVQAVGVPMLSAHFPGTGDIFTSVLTGKLMGGASLVSAAEAAAAFTTDSMEKTMAVGTPIREGILLEACLQNLFSVPAISTTYSL